MNAHEVRERREAHAEAFPRCRSCGRREGHSRYCLEPLKTADRVIENVLTESEKRLMDGNR